MKIKLVSGKEREVRVLRRAEGGLAITATVRGVSRRIWGVCAITHVASGASLGGHASVALAVEARKRLLASGVDWTRSYGELATDPAVKRAAEAEEAFRRGDGGAV